MNKKRRSVLEQISLDDYIRELFPVSKEELSEAFGKPTSAERRQRAQQGYEKRLGDYNAQKDNPDFDGEEPTPPVETSTLSRRLGKLKGGKNLIDKLHKTHKLSNEADLQPVSVATGKEAAELAWNQFNRNSDDFVIVAGKKGVGAVKPEKESLDAFVKSAQDKGKEPSYAKHAGAIKYQVIAYTDDGNRVPPELLRQTKYKDDRYPDPTMMKARMGKVHGRDMQNPDNIFNLLDAQIGPITTVWIAGWEGTRGEDNSSLPHSPGAVERDKINKRAELNKPAPAPEPAAVLRNTAGLFVPLVTRLLTKASAELSQEIERATREDDDASAEAAMKSKKVIRALQSEFEANNDVYASSDKFRKLFNKSVVDAAGGPEGSAEYEDFIEELSKKKGLTMQALSHAISDNFMNAGMLN